MASYTAATTDLCTIQLYSMVNMMCSSLRNRAQTLKYKYGRVYRIYKVVNMNRREHTAHNKSLNIDKIKCERLRHKGGFEHVKRYSVFSLCHSK